MQNRWYFPGSLHNFVFEFLRRYCQNPDSLVQFAHLCQKKRNSKSYDFVRLKAGLVSKQELLDFFLEVGEGSGVSIGNPLARIYDSLVYWDIFTELPMSGNLLIDFQINFLVVNAYASRGVLENIVKGPGIIPTRYQSAVAAIVVEKNSQESVGSGSVVSHNGTVFILTNKHVINPAENIRITKVLLADSEHPAPHSDLIISESDDLAAFRINVPEINPRFFLGETVYTLQEVILLGFPKIPLTIRPHLTVHTGEINATIKTRNDEELYLISNYASPGSSGGPLIDYRGLLIGVVSDSLEAQYDDAVFQHTAAITLTSVRRFVESKVLPALS